jgi:hypothetical protein
VYATRRFYAQAPPLLSRANFDLAGAHPGLKTGLRERSESVDNAAIFHRKAPAVPWAFHTFAIELPLRKVGDKMRAGFCQRKNPAVTFHQHRRDIARHGLAHPAIGQLLSAITGRNFDGNS